VFQAKLVSGDKDHGVQSFFARIRDPSTTDLFQGVEVGESASNLNVAEKAT